MIDPDPQLVDRLVELTRDLILIPGTEDRPDDRERCFAFCRNHIEGVPGTVITEYRSEGIPSFVALPEGVTVPSVLMLGHLDVVTHSDPLAYQSHIENGRIVGPGAGDMKGALAILLELFRRLHEAQPGISLGLAVTSDEEIGGEHGIKHLLEQGVRAGAALIPDGGALDRVTTEEKGMCHIHLRSSGEAAHGSRPWLGDNALEKMVDRVAELRAWFDTLENEDGHWHPTCALTHVATGNRSCNRIPAHAEALLDVRFPPPFTRAEMEAEIVARLGDEIEVEVLLGAEPLKVEPDPLYLEACSERLGRPARLGRDDGASDARYLAPYNIPVIISRPSVGLLHNVDEWIDIRSMGIFYEICDVYLRQRLLGVDA